MKIKKLLIFILSISIIFCILSLNSFAMNTGFTVCDIEPEDEQNLISNLDVTLITEEPEKEYITCFDVNDDGLILLVDGITEIKTVSVYTSDGTFKYRYELSSSGNCYAEWDGDNVIIYYVRSDIAALFDNTGKLLEVKRIENTAENNSYWYELRAEERTVNGNKYVMKNDMGVLNFFSTAYSQFVVTDADGNTKIILDLSKQMLAGTIIVVTLVMAVFICAIVIIIHFVKKSSQKRKANEDRESSVE